MGKTKTTAVAEKHKSKKQKKDEVVVEEVQEDSELESNAGSSAEEESAEEVAHIKNFDERAGSKEGFDRITGHASSKDKTWMQGIGANVDSSSSITQVLVRDVISISFDGDKDLDSVRATWEVEQEQIAKSVVEIDTADFDYIAYYAGADISFHKDDPNKAIATLVVFERRTHRVVAEVSCMCRTEIPYIPSFLAYREAPILVVLLDVLKRECGEFMPELVVLDGNGIWHPRFSGVASHFSILTGVPCIGVAKKILAVSSLSRDQVLAAMSHEKGSMVDFKVDGRVIGTGFNSTGCINSAMYISVGNGISLETAKAFIREVTIHKVVEPVRCADLVSRRILRAI